MKKLFAWLLAGLLAGSCLPAGAFALQSHPTDGCVSVYHDDNRLLNLYDADGSAAAASPPSGDGYSFDVEPGEVYYLPLGIAGGKDRYTLLFGADSGQANDSARAAACWELADPDRFSLRADGHGEGARQVRITQAGELRLEGDAARLLDGRGAWLKIEVRETEMEITPAFDLLFTARKDGETFQTGDYAELRLAFRVGAGAEESSGSGLRAIRPDWEDDGTLMWGELASLAFAEEENCAAKLSVAVDSDVASRYGEQAELAFRSFLGEDELPSRAVLTLKNPWAEDGSARARSGACRIYSIAPDGMLTDMTSLFTYVATDEDGNDVNGWRMRTRTLGSYVISSGELAL